MIDRLLVILERLAPHGESFFQDERGFLPSEGVPLDGVGGIGELDIVPSIELRQRLLREGAERVEPLLFMGDGLQHAIEHSKL